MVGFGAIDARADFTARLAQRPYLAVLIIRLAARENRWAGQVFEGVAGNKLFKHR